MMRNNQNGLGKTPTAIEALLQQINGIGPMGQAVGGSSLAAGPYGADWYSNMTALNSQNMEEIMNNLMSEISASGGGNGGGGGGGGGGMSGGGGYSGSGAYGEGNAGMRGGGDPSRFAYGPDELGAWGSSDPFSNGNFQAPAAFASGVPAGQDVYEAYFNEVYAPQLEKDPYTKIPSWAWKYAVDADGRGYPPGAYGQLSDGSWVTPDGLDPWGVDTGQYSMDAFGKNPPGQETGPGSPGADFDRRNHPAFAGTGVPDGKAPAVIPSDNYRPMGQGGSISQTWKGSGGGGRRRGGAQGAGKWAGPARRPNHPNGGFQANGSTAFGGGGRNVPSGGGNSFPGGGYAAPGQIDRGIRNGEPERMRTEPDWSRHAERRMGGGDGRDVVRTSDNGRRVKYDDGTFERAGKERERVRTSSGPAGTNTNINISRNGGTAISNQSGGDGNRGRNAGNGGSANSNADRQRVVAEAQRAAQQKNNNNNKKQDDRKDDKNKKR